LRHERGLTGESLGLLAGVDISYLNHAENHGRNLTWERVAALAEALGVSMSELVERAEAIAARDRAGSGEESD
jgi:transcriptional regulator with XRE-family HTH domain